MSKANFENLIPDQNRLLQTAELEAYVAWLAARYSRPALPTTFNDRLAAADPKDKLRKKAKAGNECLSGIYVEITPDRELSDDEHYKVNLLGILTAGLDKSMTGAQTALDEYANIMRNAQMDVTVALRTENEVSVATIKRFKRFYYDDLSFKSDTALPPEVENIL